VLARDPGAFGNEVSVLVDAHYVNNSKVISHPVLPSATLVLSAVDFLELGSKVQLETANGASREVATIQAIDATTKTVTLTATVATDYAGGKLFLIGWRTAVSFGGAVVETLSGLSSVLDTGGNASAFAAQVAARSQWIRIGTGVTPPTLSPALNGFPTFALAQPVLLSGAGSTGTATAADVIGTDVPPRKGLKAIEAQDGINIIAAPGFTQVAVVSELIAQAERRMDRFAVFESSFDPAAPPPEVPEVLTERANYNSRFGAMYHPWLRVLDPLSGTDIALPPSGHVLGAYARTDNDRGVFKAPANVVLRGITGFTQDITNGEQDLLNPNGVNVLRRFEGLGLVIWGARTISAESLWKYVPVRRLFIFLEQSIVKGTRFAVFEPNDLRLWARLRDAVTNFLTTQWRAGALFGARPEEAFFVKVDETTTTQDDRDNGRVNIIVGIAPVKPAEFIVFQIGQAPQSVIIAEQG